MNPYLGRDPSPRYDNDRNIPVPLDIEHQHDGFVLYGTGANSQQSTPTYIASPALPQSPFVFHQLPAEGSPYRHHHVARAPAHQPFNKGIPKDFDTEKDVTIKSMSADKHPKRFRGYAWKIWQEVLSEVSAKQTANKEIDDRDLLNFAGNLLAVEECCVARENYSRTSLVYKKLRQTRQMVGVWQALSNLGSMPVGWYRWANLVFILVRALCNCLLAGYLFAVQRENFKHKRYSAVVQLIYYFEFLIVTGWALWCCKDGVRLANTFLYHSQRRSAKSSLQVVRQSVGLTKMLFKIGEFSSMSGAKHVLSVPRLTRFYRQIYIDIRNSGDMMFNMATATLDDVLRMPFFRKVVKAVAGESGRQWLRNRFATNHTHRSNSSGSALKQASTLTSLPSLSSGQRTTWQIILAHILKAPMVLFSVLLLLLLPFAFLVWCTWPLWGITALFVKIYQLDFIVTTHILKWKLMELVRFVGFLNQLAIFETSEQSKLDGQLLLLFWGKDAQINTMESTATFCFQECVVLDAWQRPGGSLLAGLAKLCWLTAEDINWAFISENGATGTSRRRSSWG